MGILDKVYAIRPFKKMMDALAGTKRKKRDGVDLRRAAVLLEGYNWFKDNTSGAMPTEDDVVDFYKKIEGLGDSGQRNFVHENITRQVVDMFTSLEQYNAELEDNTRSTSGKRSQMCGKKSLTPLSELCGFSLQTKPSGIDGAGDGLFVTCASDSMIYPGTVLGFMPGLVYLKEHLNTKEKVNALFPDDDLMLMTRTDGIIIDSRTAHQVPANPFALGHYVNHPPSSSEPNVLQASFDFEQDPFGISEFPKHLRHLIPNGFASERTYLGSPDRTAYMHTIVLIAAKPLASGDELLLDYRLNPDMPDRLPVWYTHYDEMAARERLQIED